MERSEQTETCVPALEALQLMLLDLSEPGVFKSTNESVLRNPIADW